ncbi:hypothetical protein EJ03DRAFT_324524 [Teratosphaeria nubilosa]|uniref:Uncharacterized protein n=1 Tax=Teratosphaeria nubilosa TaxID=161662 RepID=A0A6G1LHU1_9PEZI|nr:hypothetical protein EJ03DRAFT_324524 [Teratosphaeria nubilosa]
MAPLLYELTVPIFISNLENLKQILQKAEVWAREKGVREEEVMGARLREDMFPLPFQFHLACNAAKFVPVRVAGMENHPDADDAKTFADLGRRLDTTIAFLQSVKPESFEGKEVVTVEVKSQFANLKFTGLEYIQKWAMPNHFFHVTTAYAILRKEGVEVGKWDFLGPLRETHAGEA